MSSGEWRGKITYWAPKPAGFFSATFDAFFAPVVLEALEVQTRIKTVDPKVSSNSKHFSCVVVAEQRGGPRLEVGGFVYLGESQEADPGTVFGARKIVGLGSKPDLRALKQLTVAYFG